VDSFPTSLPLPKTSGYGFDTDAGVIKSKTEGGTTRARRQYTTTTTTINCNYLFDFNEYQLFKTWFDEIANFGTSWVKMPFDIGFGVLDYESLITKEPQVGRYKDYGYEVSLEVLLRNTKNDDTPSYEFSEAVFDYDLHDYLMEMNLV
jgi:hypothetical protein